MFEFYSTFDYNNITDPESGSEYDTERDGYAQWTREFDCALLEWGDDLLGTRILSRNIADRRVSVRFLVVETLRGDEQVESIQSLLFDAGGLSGEFMLGRERPFFVTYEQTEEVWAISPEQAAERAPGAVVRIGGEK